LSQIQIAVIRISVEKEAKAVIFDLGKDIEKNLDAALMQNLPAIVSVIRATADCVSCGSRDIPTRAQGRRTSMGGRVVVEKFSSALF
jgi:hypothetical protein